MAIDQQGGAAFPAAGSSDNLEPGMTLRDYFAAQTLAEVIRQSESDSELNARKFARTAYKIADAMLAERTSTS
ncbi:MAG: hypothetical protein AAFX52_04955 [Pseudomonadota bacterium]